MDSNCNDAGCPQNSDNLEQLRILIDRLEKEGDDNCHSAAVRINEIVETGKTELSRATDSECKLRCYESIFASITAILAEIKNYV